MPAIHLYNCPICSSRDISSMLKVKDHTVSGEIFGIWHCNNCSVRFTQDIPDLAGIAGYYQSADYISHSDTKKGTINRLYHFVRTISLQQKRKWIIAGTGRKKGNILDFGCGTGAFLHTMKNAGWQVTGLEPDAGARQKAGELYGLNILPAKELYHLPEGQYDAITLWHVLEHVHHLQEDLRQAKKLLRPGGKLFIAVPNYTSLDASIYKEHWAAYDVPRHLYHFSPDAMKALLQEHGLQITGLHPMVFDAFYISLLSEKYLHGKTRFIPGILNGSRSWLYAANTPSRSSSVVYIAE